MESSHCLIKHLTLCVHLIFGCGTFWNLRIPVAKPDTTVPAELGDAFMEIATVREKLDRFLERQNAAATPLTRALLAGEKFALLAEVENSLTLLNQMQERALSDLRAADEAWPDVSAEKLYTLSQRLTYLEKWMAQLREGLVQLNF